MQGITQKRKEQEPKRWESNKSEQVREMEIRTRHNLKREENGMLMLNNRLAKD